MPMCSPAQTGGYGLLAVAAAAQQSGVRAFGCRLRRRSVREPLRTGRRDLLAARRPRARCSRDRSDVRSASGPLASLAWQFPPRTRHCCWRNSPGWRLSSALGRRPMPAIWWRRWTRCWPRSRDLARQRSRRQNLAGLVASGAVAGDFPPRCQPGFPDIRRVLVTAVLLACPHPVHAPIRSASSA
jgi:hypothetical protein